LFKQTILLTNHEKIFIASGIIYILLLYVIPYSFFVKKNSNICVRLGACLFPDADKIGKGDLNRNMLQVDIFTLKGLLLLRNIAREFA
jgi:hypothetical protein